MQLDTATLSDKEIEDLEKTLIRYKYRVGANREILSNSVARKNALTQGTEKAFDVIELLESPNEK